MPSQIADKGFGYGTNETDGRYDYTKPWVTNTPSGMGPKWGYLGPWASNMERLTQQALMVATIPGVQIQDMVRPPLPQIQLFPDRYGYGDRTQPTIEDVISVDRVYMEPRISWYSGSPAGYSGTSRNDLGNN
jgi:hypothetical protein